MNIWENPCFERVCDCQITKCIDQRTFSSSMRHCWITLRISTFLKCYCPIVAKLGLAILWRMVYVKQTDLLRYKKYITKSACEADFWFEQGELSSFPNACAHSHLKKYMLQSHKATCWGRVNTDDLVYLICHTQRIQSEVGDNQGSSWYTKHSQWVFWKRSLHVHQRAIALGLLGLMLMNW